MSKLIKSIELHPAMYGSLKSYVPEEKDFFFELEISVHFFHPIHYYFELFSCILGTPSGLKKFHESQFRLYAGRGISHEKIIVVEKYDYVEITRFVEKIVKSCERPSYEETISCLCNYFYWQE
ncbi:MAG: hypothetical protein JNM36_16025 [Chitinophagales bacterium]|nr:hypothetical protein [Chitinophagales bacterium]